MKKQNRGRMVKKSQSCICFKRGIILMLVTAIVVVCLSKFLTQEFTLKKVQNTSIPVCLAKHWWNARDQPVNKTCTQKQILSRMKNVLQYQFIAISVKLNSPGQRNFEKELKDFLENNYVNEFEKIVYLESTNLQKAIKHFKSFHSIVYRICSFVRNFLLNQFLEISNKPKLWVISDLSLSEIQKSKSIDRIFQFYQALSKYWNSNDKLLIVNYKEVIFKDPKAKYLRQLFQKHKFAHFHSHNELCILQSTPISQQYPEFINRSQMDQQLDEFQIILNKHQTQLNQQINQTNQKVKESYKEIEEMENIFQKYSEQQQRKRAQKNNSEQQQRKRAQKNQQMQKFNRSIQEFNQSIAKKLNQIKNHAQQKMSHFQQKMSHLQQKMSQLLKKMMIQLQKRTFRNENQTKKKLHTFNTTLTKLMNKLQNQINKNQINNQQQMQAQIDRVQKILSQHKQDQKEKYYIDQRSIILAIIVLLILIIVTTVVSVKVIMSLYIKQQNNKNQQKQRIQQNLKVQQNQQNQKNFQKKINQMQKKINQKNQQYQQNLQKKINQMQKKISQMQKKINQMQKKINQMQKKINQKISQNKAMQRSK